MVNFFNRIFHSIQANKGLSAFGLVGMLCVFGYFASNIEFEEDITKLIPTNSNNAQAQKVLKTVNFADKVVVHITTTQQTADDLTRFAEMFLDTLNHKASNYITDIQGHIEDKTITSTMAFVYANLPLFLDAEDYKGIEQKMNPDSIKAITKGNYKTLISPSGIIAKKSILKDPLGLTFTGLEKLQTLNFGKDFNLHNGFLVSKDQKHLLLFVTPKYASSETAKNSAFANILYQIGAQLNNTFEQKTTVSYFGGALIAVENAKQIKQDILFTVGIALTVLLLILILFYRKLVLPIILFIPTVFGALLAITVLYFIRDKISAISLGIGSVLLGVTLDYALHILTHIRSNNNIKSLYTEIAKPILMSSLTTALAFLCLLFLHSQALQDLGIFAAISVVGSAVFALVFIPQAYRDTQKNRPKNTIIDTFSALALHKKPWLFVALGACLILSIFTYKTVSFNNDITKLNYEPPKLMEAQKQLDALTNATSKSVYIAAYGSQTEAALQANDSIYQTLKQLKARGHIIDFSSIAGIVQSKALQQEKLNTWQTFWDDSTKTNLKQLLVENGTPFGFKPETFQPFYNFLNQEFSTLNNTDYQALNTIRTNDYITTKNHFTTIASLVKLDENNLNLLNNAFKHLPNTLVIDRQSMNETFLGNLKNDFNQLIGYSLVVVLLVLLFFYRSLSLTLVTSIPIALTWFLTIGIMGLLGIEFNIFNIIISTFIFGLGVDYSIFITNGLLHEYRTGEQALPTHKASILLSVITTILGVGVLVFAKHPALHSMSVVSIIGILSALIISFTIQPVLFRLFIGSKHKRPITLRLLLHAIGSFTYYGLGTFLLPLIGMLTFGLIPVSKKIKMPWFHKLAGKFMTSVLYTNPFVKKKIINQVGEDFKKPAIIIANHTSFLDTLTIAMVHHKVIFLVNDWVYKSPIFGQAMKFAGYYPVSEGIENGLDHLKTKIDQGYSLVVFPEGTRSYTNKIKRFHKGAFFLAEKFQLDILPILIHGNSEVLPKGSFPIKNGSITLKVLERIPYNDTSFGNTARARTKSIGLHVKKAFKAFRQEIEHDSYFHNIVLEDYRYKGDALYNNVKQALKSHKSRYKQIMDAVNEQEQVVHLSQGYGQLDTLLALDSPARTLTTYINHPEYRAIVANNYAVNNHSNITISPTVEAALSQPHTTLILDLADLKPANFTSSLQDIKTVILLNESCIFSPFFLEHNTLSFQEHLQADGLMILKRKTEST
ncbi:glycerol acyltransferase [Mangrovimonas yunxiaonensis]|uniref:Glycerol acyltransferase n=1 Tax=Mangrovimonas yunxiaonensis TaxID=1197477 RepID=A0A084TKA2_9FLAO|nr:MMPL family transporter [Mangrovimonas yunxiaonensis]KFB01138.1 glycerol acyltransferase [Mangrovimonas yunxiaonensis]GGH38444.1 glycerol acyltransferase [Mangrovimonas yunxiaonensis]